MGENSLEQSGRFGFGAGVIVNPGRWFNVGVEDLLVSMNEETLM